MARSHGAALADRGAAAVALAGRAGGEDQVEEGEVQSGHLPVLYFYITMSSNLKHNRVL